MDTQRVVSDLKEKTLKYEDKLLFAVNMSFKKQILKSTLDNLL